MIRQWGPTPTTADSGQRGLRECLVAPGPPCVQPEPDTVLVTLSCGAGTRSPCLSLSDLEVLRSFQSQIAAIQRDAVWWLHTVVPSISKLAPKDYVHWYGPSVGRARDPGEGDLG